MNSNDKEKLKKEYKRIYDKVCSDLITDVLIDAGSFKKIMDIFKKSYPDIFKNEIKSKFIITDLVKAHKYFQNKLLSGESITKEDENKVKDLHERLKLEQSKKEYEYYAVPQVYEAGFGEETLEKYVFRKILEKVKKLKDENVIG